MDPTAWKDLERDRSSLVSSVRALGRGHHPGNRPLESARPLAEGPGRPCQPPPGLCQAQLSQQPALRGGFVKGIILHSEETTQLPLPGSPKSTKLSLCVPATSWSAQTPPTVLQGQGTTRGCRWEPRGPSAKALLAHQARLHAWDAAATLWQRPDGPEP